VPTIAESGIAGFASTSWQGLFLPARTPRYIVDAIQTQTGQALQAVDIRERLEALSYAPIGSTPAEFAAYFKAELARFAEVVRQARIPPQD
jgi:tripartite-type tricarboxylate transporter receptor subunit TctC